jgi:hypothetical protein
MSDNPIIYQYPPHFRYPTDNKLYFANNVKLWLENMPDLIGKPNVTLEIGALYGAASVFILDMYCNVPESHHHIVDINTNSIIEHNIAPYSNCSYHIGESSDILRGFQKDTFDFAYIDGNHMAKNVLEDAVNCAYIVKPNGYIVFDDYTWGLSEAKHCQPKTGVDGFMWAYEKYFDVVFVGHQVILRKKAYELTIDESSSNYVDYRPTETFSEGTFVIR